MSYNHYSLTSSHYKSFKSLGYIRYEDMTKHLHLTGYWASYNNPFFDDIALRSGNMQYCIDDTSTCHFYDYRGRIFREQAPKTNSMEDMMELLGYNRFRSDPISANDSCNVSMYMTK